MKRRTLHVCMSTMLVVASSLPALAAMPLSWVLTPLAERLDNRDATPQQYGTRLPAASDFYDFNGRGEKGFAGMKEASSSSEKKDLLCYYNGISDRFSLIEGSCLAVNWNPAWSAAWGDPYDGLTGIEDINKDGYLDFGISTSSKWGGKVDVVLLSNPDGTYTQMEATLLHNWDIDRDGCIEFITEKKKSSQESFFSIYSRQPGGELLKRPLRTVSYEDYNSSFDPTQWNKVQESVQLGKLPVVADGGGSMFSGAALEPRAMPISSKVPKQNIDLNRDGVTDLVDPTVGTIYYGTPEGTYVMSSIGGAVKSKDLNEDGVADFIIHGGDRSILKTLIYQGGGEFKETVLMDNLAADDEIYCRDFDKDGDVDILVTFSSLSTDGTAYILFFENDGQGNFTSHEDYSDSRLMFYNCRDVDNDGYYDLLFVEYGDLPEGGDENTETDFKIMLRRGGAGFTFGQAEELYRVRANYLATVLPQMPKQSRMWSWSLNAEDIDNDGLTEIWLSEGPGWKPVLFADTQIHKMVSVKQNTAPSTPTTPRLLYNAGTGQLDIDWDAATDAQCSSKDLTYALRIGTAPGKGDVVYAHANADGSRRNFLEGNAGGERNKTYDTRTWKAGNYHVSVQAIDPSHKGSAWSGEAVFKCSYLPAEFTLSMKTLSTTDVLTAYYTETDGCSYQWETDGATLLPEEGKDGKVQMQWSTGGKKKLTLTVTGRDGAVATFTSPVSVLANRVFVTDNEFGHSEFHNYHFADYDLDGYADYALLDGLYHNEKGNGFVKAKGIFNQGLKYNDAVWMDYDMDGKPDLMYDTYTPGHGRPMISGVLKNNGNGNFTKVSSPDIKVIGSSGYGSDVWVGDMLDINNDGFMDVCGLSDEYCINRGNKEFEWVKAPAPAEENPVIGSLRNVVDWDKDGLWDQYELEVIGNSCSGLTLRHNQGNYRFVKETIPFAQGPIDSKNLKDPLLTDFDNDGYLDLVFIKNNRALHVLKNVKNTYFETGYDILPDDECLLRSDMEGFQMFDLDNNGYEDILIVANDKSRGDSLALYAIYVEEPGEYLQGFISAGILSTDMERPYSPVKLATLSPDGVPFIHVGTCSEVANGSWVARYVNDHRTNVTNTRPQAPDMVTAVQTEESLLIEWNPAKDKETPTTRMRYNLSVRKKGETGPGSYIISPMNGGEATAAALPCTGIPMEFYCRNFYPTATRFEIPLSALPIGELEIQVQSIDLWAAMSEFSKPVTVQIVNKPLLKAESGTCFEEPVTITYKGTQSGDVKPEWDFDGGEVLDGEAYGPYRVQWSESGVKQVSVTVSGETSSVNIRVLPDYSSVFSMPARVFYDTDVEITLPEVPKDATFKWALSGESAFTKDFTMTAQPGKKKGVFRVVRNPGVAQRSLTLTVEQNGCAKEYTCDFEVLPKLEPPVLALVTSVDTRNVITWKPGNMPVGCSEVIVYKEGSYLNDFREIGRVAKSEARFTDLTSNNTVKSERYAISMQMDAEVESPMSAIHQTILLTINKGMAANQWNLIWNGYQGRGASAYRILRGASADALHELATLPGSVTSYADMASDASEPYYALEFIPVEEEYARMATRASDQGVRTNMVYAGDARNINYVNRLEILSVEKEMVIDEAQRALYLYVEVYPVNATYQQVVWSITKGEDIAVIDNYGCLKAKGNGRSGNVTVQAKAIDGSGIVATRIIPVTGFVLQPDAPVNLNVSVSDASAMLSWEGEAQDFVVSWYKKGMEAQSASVTTVNKEYLISGLEEGSTYGWTVTARNGETVSPTVPGPDFAILYVGLETTERLRVTVYPLPATDYLYVVLADKTLPVRAELVDIKGIPVKRWQSCESPLDIRQLVSGLYLLRLFAEDGSVVVKKVTIK